VRDPLVEPIGHKTPSDHSNAISKEFTPCLPSWCKLQFVFHGTIFGAIKLFIHRQILLAVIPVLW
jgi:hypothetical protein